MKNLKKQIKTLKDSISRPKEVLIEYRKLKRDALRDEKILASLEKQILFYKLTEAQKSDPWELISNPTISGQQIGVPKRIIVLYGMLFGLLSGAVLGLIIDKKKDLIFHLDEFKKFIDSNYLISIPIDNLKKSKVILEIINQNFDISKKDSKDLIYCGNKNADNSLFDDLDELLHSNNMQSIKEYSFISKAKEIILFVAPGQITKKEMRYINELIKITKVNVIGWIFLESNKSKL